MKILAALTAIPLLLGFGGNLTEEKVINKRTVTNSPAAFLDLTTDTNVVTAYKFLTGTGIVNASNGKLQPMSSASASGMIANWVVETGSRDLTTLDVVEYNGGAGRGMSQYTGVRRQPYDTARLAELNSGGDPNSIEFQLTYFVEEYIGLYDYQGSLIGWTLSLEKYSSLTSPERAAETFARTYFRPSRPHYSRRMYEARRIYNLLQDIIVTNNEPNSRTT